MAGTPLTGLCLPMGLENKSFSPLIRIELYYVRATAYLPSVVAQKVYFHGE